VPLQTWSNRADALIQLAQALSEAPQSDVAAIAADALPGDSLEPSADALDVAHAAIEQARAAYLEATSLCSSENGDDLPGLLCNWATGLQAAAEVERARHAPVEAMELLNDAVHKLHSSLDFNRVDIQVRTNIAGQLHAAGALACADLLLRSTCCSTAIMFLTCLRPVNCKLAVS
jgi:hypothetical protein